MPAAPRAVTFMTTGGGVKPMKRKTRPKLLDDDGEDADGNVTIKLQPAGRMTHERLALLRATDLLVIDEYSSLHRSIVEALLRFLRAQRVAIRVLLVGDLQQAVGDRVGVGHVHLHRQTFATGVGDGRHRRCRAVRVQVCDCYPATLRREAHADLAADAAAAAGHQSNS